MGILTRAEKRLVEHNLRRYEIYRARVDEYYAGIGGARHPEVMSRASRPGDPTASQAMAAVDPPWEVKEAQRWLTVHRMTGDRLDVEKRGIYERMCKGDERDIEVMISLPMDRATFYRYKDDIITTFALCAAIKGMIQLVETKSATFLPV